MSSDLRVCVSSFFYRHNLTGSKLVVAVSGGPDSVCLLHLLYSLKYDLGIELHVGHLDHCLRGEASRADADYVADLAYRLEVPATIGQGDVKTYAKEKKLSLEEAAREVRYGFLAQLAQSLGTGMVVTGHTRNDNIETILLHIIRGSGTRGLVGLKPLTARTIEGRSITVVRPMIDITKEETVGYCRQFRLEPRLDSSNLELSPMRNKIRLKLLPLLEGYNVNISGALLRLSASATDELDYLDEQVVNLWAKVAKKEGDVITLDREGLRNVRPAIKRQLLRVCLEQLRGSLKDIESRHIEDMLSLIDKPSGRRITLPHGLVFMAGYDNYSLGKEKDFPNPFSPLDGRYPLTIHGITELPGWRVEAQIVTIHDKCDNGLVAYFDADAVGSNLNVRTWEKGDHFQPLGMGNEKKLGDFMIDAKIPRLWRHNIPMVISPSGIVWLVGYRLDDRMKVTPETKRVLRLKFKRV